jgi:bloom syndrome protein
MVVEVQVFGNQSFRSQQRHIIQAALDGHDCFVLMPTGGRCCLLLEHFDMQVPLRMAKKGAQALCCCWPSATGGKSLTYQLPAVLTPGITGALGLRLLQHDPLLPSFHVGCLLRLLSVSSASAVVVTPLLSLMQDQVQSLTLLPSGGVPTTYISSQQTVTETRVRACGRVSCFFDRCASQIPFYCMCLKGLWATTPAGW